MCSGVPVDFNCVANVNSKGQKNHPSAILCPRLNIVNVIKAKTGVDYRSVKFNN